MPPHYTASVGRANKPQGKPTNIRVKWWCLWWWCAIHGLMELVLDKNLLEVSPLHHMLVRVAVKA